MKQCEKSKGSKLRQSWGSILGKGGCSRWGSQTCSPSSEAEAESFGVGEDHASHQASKFYRGWYQYAPVHCQAQHSGSALRNKIPVVQARYSKGVVVQGGTHRGLTDTRWGQSLGSVLRNKIPVRGGCSGWGSRLQPSEIRYLLFRLDTRKGWLFRVGLTSTSPE